MSKPFECNVVRFREAADKCAGPIEPRRFVHVPFQSRRMRPNNNRNNRPNFFFFFYSPGLIWRKNLLGGREWSNGYHPDDYLIYPSLSTRVLDLWQLCLWRSHCCDTYRLVNRWETATGVNHYFDTSQNIQHPHHLMACFNCVLLSFVLLKIVSVVFD